MRGGSRLQALTDQLAAQESPNLTCLAEGRKTALRKLISCMMDGKIVCSSHE